MYHPISGYVYVANNPVNFTDPTGMKIEEGSAGAWAESYNYWDGKKMEAEDAIRSTQSKAASEGWSQQRLTIAMSPLTQMSSTAAGNLEKLMSVANASEYYKTTSPGHWEVVVEEKKAANQGGLTHDQELAKYGQIVGFGNVSISGAYGAGLAYEYGIIETDKGWLQKYQTVYSLAGAGISGGITGGMIIGKGNPYPRPPVDLSRSYINTQTYLGGQ